MIFEAAKRITALPPYLFTDLDRRKNEVLARGADIIDLGVGDPDRPTPEYIVDALKNAVGQAANHRYSPDCGLRSFRSAVADWYRRRHGVDLNPETEICCLFGSKDGLSHFPLGVLNPGDLALVPEPAYPVYNIGTLLAGGHSVFMPLLERNGFLPDFEAVDDETLARVKCMWINYPNNPTGACAPRAFYERLAAWAAEHKIIVASDAAYSELTRSGEPHPSLLEVAGGKEVGIEFHSFSKTYNMTGWRLGWAAGNASLIGALSAVKSNTDSGVFPAIQEAGVAALAGDQSLLREKSLMYLARREILSRGLAAAGLQVFPSPATFYIWAGLPVGLGSAAFAERLLDETGILCAPGRAFGPSGEGYARFALTQGVDLLKEAANRLADFKL